jgi:plasmid stabilization system protein ParE
MSALPSYKEIVGLIKKGATIEAQERIMALREACVALQDENHAMREKMKVLEEALKFKKTLEYRVPFYYAEGDSNPFCPRCWEKDKRAIHLSPERILSGARARPCPDCKAEFKTGNISAGIA